jgi:hypothetical protein
MCSLTFCGSVAHYLGLLAATLGHVDEAESHFSDAVSVQERMRAPAWVARTRLEWARLLLSSAPHEHQARGLQLLRRALAGASELGLAALERDARFVLDRNHLRLPPVAS